MFKNYKDMAFQKCIFCYKRMRKGEEIEWFVGRFYQPTGTLKPWKARIASSKKYLKQRWRCMKDFALGCECIDVITNCHEPALDQSLRFSHKRHHGIFRFTWWLSVVSSFRRRRIVAFIGRMALDFRLYKVLLYNVQQAWEPVWAPLRARKSATRSVWNVLSSGLVVKTVWTCAPFIESVSRNIIG